MIHHFSTDGKIVQTRKSPMHGFLIKNLVNRQDYKSKEEIGNVAIEIPNVSMYKKKMFYNYISIENKRKMVKMYTSIMFSHFWTYMLPHIRARKTCKKISDKENSLYFYTTKFFKDNGITVTDDAMNRFLVEIFREKKRLKENYDITI